jgi:hypothetical protein
MLSSVLSFIVVVSTEGMWQLYSFIAWIILMTYLMLVQALIKNVLPNVTNINLIYYTSIYNAS